MTDPDRESIPLAREELDVAKRNLETARVRITKVVHEREETVDVPLEHEEVEVERVKVERVLDGPAGPREEDGVLIVPVVEERLVVQKRLVVVEELHVRRRKVERTHEERIRLRSEEAVVEREPARDIQPSVKRKEP